MDIMLNYHFSELKEALRFPLKLSPINSLPTVRDLTSASLLRFI